MSSGFCCAAASARQQAQSNNGSPSLSTALVFRGHPRNPLFFLFMQFFWTRLAVTRTAARASLFHSFRCPTAPLWCI